VCRDGIPFAFVKTKKKGDISPQKKKNTRTPGPPETIKRPYRSTQRRGENPHLNGKAKVQS